jgi:hypothetical protein
MHVTLTWSEVIAAALVGVMRQVQNLRDKRKDRNGCPPEEGWTFHINGACGETALAKGRASYWTGMGALGDLDARDVGGLQARTTPYPNGRLKIYPNDNDDDVFVLVRGSAPTFELVGWMTAREAKAARDDKGKDFLCDPTNGGRPPAYFVPAPVLHPMEELP